MQIISTKEQFKIWSYVAANSFGGPAGQIAVIHKLVVEDKKIISEERFLHALNFCMLLPGPEAQQLATYMGWLIGKWKGGLIAGLLFILPGFLSILALSYIYVIFNDVSFVQGIFYGMKPAILAVVVAALIRISKKSLNNLFYKFIAILAFIALFFFNISFPFIVIVAAISGLVYGKFFNKDLTPVQEISKPSLKNLFTTISLWTFIWMLPILITIYIWGTHSTFHHLNLFFSKMSMVTFGGAYAALNYVAQKAVDVYGWLYASEMLDGLAMAETTPGPLIQTVQFVGFMGAYRFPDITNSPLISAFVGSVLTTWMTFAPCFLWIFSFAPYVEFIRGKKIFADALKTITASVVGVILNLSIWFTLNVIFRNKTDYYALSITILALVLQFKFKKGLFTILGTCSVCGILIKYLNTL